MLLFCSISVHGRVAKDAIADADLVLFIASEEAFVKLKRTNVLNRTDPVED